MLPKLENESIATRGIDVEAAGLGSGAESNLAELFGGGLDVHAGVREEVHLVLGGDERVESGNTVQSFAHANDLQARDGSYPGNAG